MPITMHLCPPLNYSWGHPEPSVSLGILSLGAVAESMGHTVRIKDINTFCTDANDFGHVNRLAGFLAENKPDILGFSTLCNCYPLTLGLARECKRLSPGTLIMLGGPQATVTASETMRHFDYVDAILVGEGEEAFKAFLSTIEAGNNWEDIPNLVWRSNTNIIHNKLAPLIENLDELLLPAYHLNAFPLHTLKSIPVESGRGCPYQCTYCSTTRFWGKRFRMKSVGKLLNEIRTITSTYGLNTIELTQDNFTSSRQFVLQFCSALKNSGLNIKWACGARIDAVNEEMAKEMADTGCCEIFFGIETGSENVQKSINKQMDYSCVVSNAEVVSKQKMQFTASFICGFPEESLSDLRDTLLLMFKLNFAAGERHYTYLHMLSPLQGTPIYHQHKEKLKFDGHPSDIAVSDLRDDDKELIKRHPDIFSSFYIIPNKIVQRPYIRRLYMVVNFVMDFPFSTCLLWKNEGERLIDTILERAGYLQTGDTNIFTQDRLKILENIYIFFQAQLLTNMTPIEGISDLLLYEYISKRVVCGGSTSHIEVFNYDIEAAIQKIRQKKYNDPLKDERGLTAILFAKEKDKVKTTKLSAPLLKMLTGIEGRGVTDFGDRATIST